MAPSLDYYFTPQSPWTYLGHQRFVRMVKSAGAEVRVLPADFNKIFASSGGLPLLQRAPQRQAYRFMDLARFSRQLALPMNLRPRYFPVAGDDAARLIIAVDQHDGSEAALKLCSAIFAAVWEQERDIANPAVLQELLGETGLDAARMAHAGGVDVQQRYEANTRQAMEANIFGAPSYVIGGEIFWGQDRLEFVERALKA